MRTERAQFALCETFTHYLMKQIGLDDVIRALKESKGRAGTICQKTKISAFEQAWTHEQMTLIETLLFTVDSATGAIFEQGKNRKIEKALKEAQQILEEALK